MDFIRRAEKLTPNRRQLFTGHVARVIGSIQLDQYSVLISELEALF